MLEELEEKTYTVVSESCNDAFNEAFLRYAGDNGGPMEFLELITANNLGMKYEVYFSSKIPDSIDSIYTVVMQATSESPEN